MAKTYRQIIEELDDIILDESKSEEEKDIQKDLKKWKS